MRRARSTFRFADYESGDRQPVVTGLTPDPKVPGRVVIELDGARFASLPAEILSRESEIGEGVTLNTEVFSRLAKAADVAAAHSVALRLLAAKPRSVVEMCRALRDRGHKRDAIEQAVDRLLGAGLLDDEEFARHFVRVRTAKGHGPTRLLADLRAKGVENGLAIRIIDEVVEDEGVDLNTQIRKLAEKRLSQLGGLPKNTRRRRALAFLARRGFSGHAARDAVDHLLVGD